MRQDFFHATVGKLPTPVFRLGLSASYRPGRRVIRQAIDEVWIPGLRELGLDCSEIAERYPRP